ncbi:phosphatase PAP2 family protein [Amycolatopsis sp. NBC_00345]|uniref:phosphatase PAP2 family protein n=1 Tax=Amycolatopsis sp. NBC_00345 TaxID=2975955 RepID=UPI002E26ADB0
MPEPEGPPADAALGPVIAATVAAPAFLLLAASATEVLPWASGFDLGLHTWLAGNRSPAVVSFAAGLTATASSAFTAPLVFAVTAALAPAPLGRRLARAALVTAVMLLAVLCRFGLSALIARPRPPEAGWAVQASGLAFPSGHTSDAFLTAGLLAWLAGQRLAAHPRIRAVLWVAAAGYVVAIAWTRAYLGVHWPTDTLGSMAFGTAWLSGALAVRGVLLPSAVPGPVRSGNRSA